MEFFVTPGRFWLPRPQRRMVHGSLTFDEDGVRLVLTDPLRAPHVREDGIVSGSPEPADEAVVHGWLRDGRPVTLLRLRGWSMPADGMTEILTRHPLTRGLAPARTMDQSSTLGGARKASGGWSSASFAPVVGMLIT
jgi:hypothetical protein